MKTESGSTRIWTPKRRSPAESQVHRVEEWTLSSGRSPRSPTKATSAQTNETSVEPEASSPAWKRLMRSPSTAIATTAAAGAKRQIHAAAISSASQGGQPVHVELDALPRDGDDETEPDDCLGGGHDHHR